VIDLIVGKHVEHDAPSAVTRLDGLIHIPGYRHIIDVEGVGSVLFTGWSLDSKTSKHIALWGLDGVDQPGIAHHPDIANSLGTGAASAGTGVLIRCGPGAVHEGNGHRHAVAGGDVIGKAHIHEMAVIDDLTAVCKA